MFDDPNLHRPTYGHIDFAKLGRHAESNNYHASIATIPLDSWYVNSAAAALFREHEARMSLLIHGNDHVNNELAREIPNRTRERMVKQALKRVARLEHASGVEVCRVMAPPHGACSEKALSAMAIAGYEGATISRGSLYHHNRSARWIRTVGMRPCDIIAGLPVFPRFRVSWDCQNAILVAALLRQPIIPVGHHQDAAEGLELFSALADFVNSLGAVRWASPGQIARSHFSQRINANCLEIRMYTRRIEVAAPAGVDRLTVRRLWVGESAQKPLLFLVGGREVFAEQEGGAFTISVEAGDQVSISLRPDFSEATDEDWFNTVKPWPIIRRFITETRDRLAPTIRDWTRKSKSQ
jgi:hypothetical protein